MSNLKWMTALITLLLVLIKLYYVYYTEIMLPCAWIQSLIQNTIASISKHLSNFIWTYFYLLICNNLFSFCFISKTAAFNVTIKYFSYAQKKSSLPYEQKTVLVLGARLLDIQLNILWLNTVVFLGRYSPLWPPSSFFSSPEYFGDASAYQDHVTRVKAHIILFISESFHQTFHSALPQYSAYSFL